MRRPRLGRAGRRVGAAAVVTAFSAGVAFAVLGGETASGTTCLKAQRDAFLRTDQQQLLDLLGPLRTLRNYGDIAALHKLGYFFQTHQFVSFAGLGVIFIDPKDIPRPGHPGFIFFRPGPTSNPAAPRTPAWPYTLVGWGYNGQGYTPGVLPTIVPCMDAGDWHIHERGVHPYDSGIHVDMPPAEGWHGQSRGTFFDPPAMQPMIGYAHPRAWTLHLWYEKDGLPVVAIFDPTNPPPGFNDYGSASFFFPAHAPTG